MKKTLSQKFRIHGLLFFLGIFSSQFASDPFFISLFLFLFLLFFWIFLFLKQQKLLVFCSLFLGLFWGSFFVSFFSPEIDISRFIGSDMKISGQIISYPEFRRKDVRFYAKITQFSVSDLEKQKSQEKILMIMPKSFLNLVYGDQFTAKITPVLPTSFNRNEFDYREYLFQQHVRVMTKNVHNFKVNKKIPGKFSVFILSQAFRTFFLRNISVSLPKTHSDIAMGMTFGSKSQLPKTTENWFKNSGLQHILVVSGTNVTLLFFLVFYLCAPFGKRIVFVISFPILLFFVLVAGFDPPVLRAAIMGFLVLSSNMIGRMPDLRNFLVLALIFLGIFNPVMLQGSVSFFLSFMAMTGIILITPVLFIEFQRIFRNIFSKKIILFISAFLSAQVSVFFIISYFFKTFPIGGLLANIFADPLVPFIMGGTFVTGIISGIPLLGEISGIFLEIGISLILVIAKFFSQFPDLLIPEYISVFGIIFMCVFFVWGMISKKYEERYWREFLKKNS